MKVETREHVTRLRKWLDTNAAPTLAEDAWLLRMLKISEEPDEITAAGDIRLLQVLAINGDMAEGAIAVYGALGTGPHGEAVEVTHTREGVEARLGRLIRKADAALDDLTGDARDRMDERPPFLAAGVAAWAGPKLS
ncbi:hypothetical protein ACGFSI_34235 [Streptomyces virginiae]|uniref:hypothetical protein n=1 Tax=Streptomyces virginiae TaxID=1961 RepID=UPI0037224FDA